MNLYFSHFHWIIVPFLSQEILPSFSDNSAGTILPNLPIIQYHEGSPFFFFQIKGSASSVGMKNILWKKLSKMKQLFKNPYVYVS